jgi:hypothetical protein
MQGQGNPKERSGVIAHTDALDVRVDAPGSWCWRLAGVLRGGPCVRSPKRGTRTRAPRPPALCRVSCEGAPAYFVFRVSCADHTPRASHFTACTTCCRHTAHIMCVDICCNMACSCLMFLLLLHLHVVSAFSTFHRCSPLWCIVKGDP